MIDFKDLDFLEKKVLIRVDFNVPLTQDLKVSDDTRIRAALPTIKAVLDKGGSVVLMSHLGRPKGVVNSSYSLLPVVSVLSQLLDREVLFAKSCVSESDYELSKNLKPGEVLLLENLRFYAEETAGDNSFAKALSKHGDIYINDAFGTAHRAHASTAIIANYFDDSCKSFGLLMQSEIKSLNRALHDGDAPILAIIGGAKVSSKIDVLTSLIDKVDAVIVGGGMAYTFEKARGGHVGASLVEDDKLQVARDLIKRAEEKGVKLLLPVDSVNAKEFKDCIPSGTSRISEIPSDDMGLDIGPESIAEFKKAIVSAKTIIWNGPMGVFEFENFATGTKEIGNAIVESTQKGAFSLVGGGDSVAAIKKFKMENDVSYVSTGGGAMLEYMEGKVLPGIAAITE